jgi:hypothetical protein
VNVFFDVITTALGGMAGNISFQMLPVYAGSGTLGTCFMARQTGVTASTNYNQIQGQISPGQNVITFSQTSVTGFGTITAAVSNIAAATELAGSCAYHE